MGVVWTKVKRAIKSRGVMYAVTHGATRLGDLLHTRNAVHAKPRFTTLDDLLDFSLGKDGAFIRPFQLRSEIRNMLEVVQSARPKTMMEIGTANGGTLFLWTRVVAEDATLISLDLPSGSFGDGYPKWKSSLYKSFALPGQTIELIRDDSHAERSLETVRRLLAGRPLDFLFIDGDHSYEGVKKDFEMYSPLVRPGGIVGFHDVAHHADPLCQVEKFWLEVKEKYPFGEFIDPGHATWGGIGYVTIPTR